MAYEKSYTDKIMDAIARTMNLIQVADSYVVAENGGGLMIGLYNSNLQYPLIAVYSEDFHKLPFAVDPTLSAGDINMTDRARMEGKGYLHPCPMFGFTRWQNGVTDKGDAKFKFGDTLWVKGGTPENQPPEQATAGHRNTVATEPPEPGRVPTESGIPADQRCSATQKNRITVLAGDVFGTDWPRQEVIWSDRVSVGRTRSVYTLSPAEADQLAAGLEFLRTASRCYGESASAKVAGLLGWASRRDNAEYRLACDLPEALAAELAAGMLQAVGADVTAG